MLGQKILDLAQQRHPIRLVAELVIRVADSDESMGLTRARQCGVHDLGLLVRSLRIMITVNHEHRDCEFRGVQPRRVSLEFCRIHANLLLDNFMVKPILALVYQQAEVADACDADCTPKEVWVALRSNKCEISAEAPADDADAPRVRKPLPDGPARAIDYVLVREAAPILMSALLFALSLTSPVYLPAIVTALFAIALPH